MHGELLEFNEHLQKTIQAKDGYIKRLRDELVKYIFIFYDFFFNFIGQLAKPSYTLNYVCEITYLLSNQKTSEPKRLLNIWCIRNIKI